MRRADRLFQIVQKLRRRRVTTAAQLAAALGVSERTIYRDVVDLSASGVPILAEAGVGYALAKAFDLPPLMFTRDEVEALVLGARIVRAWADPALARAAEEALAKVESVLPESVKRRIPGRRGLRAGFPQSTPSSERACSRCARRSASGASLRLVYMDGGAQSTERVVRPLGLFFWGRAGRWAPGASCALVFATSGPIAWSAATCSRRPSRTSRGRRLAIIFRAYRTRARPRGETPPRAPFVILSAAKDPGDRRKANRWLSRSFAALRMTMECSEHVQRGEERARR
jgi:biotin operon repressor